MQFSLWEFMKRWFDRLATNEKSAYCERGRVGLLRAEYGVGVDGWDGVMIRVALWIGVGGVRGFLIPHSVRNDRGKGGRDDRARKIAGVCLEWWYLRLWIPAFAGMTIEIAGVCWGWWHLGYWIPAPAFAGVTI